MARPAKAMAPAAANSLLAAPVYLATPAGTVLEADQAAHDVPVAASGVLEAASGVLDEAAGVVGLALQVDG